MVKPQPKVIEMRKAKQEIVNAFTKQQQEKAKCWAHRLWHGRVC